MVVQHAKESGTDYKSKAGHHLNSTKMDIVKIKHSNIEKAIAEESYANLDVSKTPVYSVHDTEDMYRLVMHFR